MTTILDTARHGRWAAFAQAQHQWCQPSLRLWGTQLLVSARAAGALGDIGPPAKVAVSALAKALQDIALEVRSSAADALGSIGPVAALAVPALIEIMENNQLGMFEIAERALNRIRDPDMTGILGEPKRLDLKPLSPELHHKVTALMRESPSDTWHWLKVLTLVGKFASANKAGQVLGRDAGGVTRLLRSFQIRAGGETV